MAFLHKGCLLYIGLERSTPDLVFEQSRLRYKFIFEMHFFNLACCAFGKVISSFCNIYFFPKTAGFDDYSQLQELDLGPL